jgi:DNA invertase Pin-like site-specific DNA recombinase
MRKLTVPGNTQDLTVRFTPKWEKGAGKLPLEYPCQVYPRVSTVKQVDNVSAEMQKDKSLAIQSGWEDIENNILIDTSDLGLSGQLRMDQRPAFVTMLRRIEGGIIKAVVASQVDRLFRDRWGVEYSKFMKICYEYGVVVVTPDFVYDFSVDWHVERFRRRCEEAWSYIQRQIYERALPAQDNVGLSGRWTGGYLPMGLYVDNREKINGRKNENYLKVFPFEPWREHANWIYQRFRMNGGNVNALLREISKLPYLFPTIDAKDLPVGAFFKIAGMPVKELDEEGNERIIGYTITTHKGLRQFLTQPLLAGYWVYKNMLVRAENHEAVVDHVSFLYAFNKLSPVLLTGEPNPVYVKYVRVPRRSDVAILASVIKPEHHEYTLYPHSEGKARCSYELLPKKGTVNTVDITRAWTIPSSEVDEIFLSHFIAKLQDADFGDFFEQGDNEEVSARESLLKDLEVQLKAAEDAMKDIEEKIEKIKNPKLIEQMDQRYTAHENDIIRIQAEIKNAELLTTKAQQRRTYKQLIQDVGEYWEEVVKPEEVPVMVENFVDKIEIAVLSARFYKLTVYWSDPVWGIEEAICVRKHHTSRAWTAEEDEILIQHYANMPREELLKRLPDRTWITIIYRAMQFPVSRTLREYPSNCARRICWNDLQLLQKYDLSEEEFLHGTYRPLFCASFRPGDNQFPSHPL